MKDLGERGGVAVLRSEFDHWLLRKAADAGATIREATAFERVETRADGIAVTTSRGVLSARYLVGADGVFSQVRHAVFGARRRDLRAGCRGAGLGHARAP